MKNTIGRIRRAIFLFNLKEFSWMHSTLRSKFNSTSDSDERLPGVAPYGMAAHLSLRREF